MVKTEHSNTQIRGAIKSPLDGTPHGRHPPISSAQHCYQTFMSRVPTLDFAGVALANDEAALLMYICTALKNALNLQLDAIGKMPSTSNEHVVTRIRQIQIRHIDIHIHLSTIVSRTKRSTVLWVPEFGDGNAALERKIVSMNRHSRGLNWIHVARQCWPGVAVTYGWLLPLISRLQGELRRALKPKEPWTVDDTTRVVEEVEEEDKQEQVALYSTPRRVHFGREAAVREYQIGSTVGEQSFGKQSTALLSNDAKRTAGNFRRKKTKFEIWLSDSELKT